MPKRSINTGDIQVNTTNGSDFKESYNPLNPSNRSLSASQVRSTGSNGAFLGNDVQQNLDSLTLANRPPLLGHGPITFSNGTLSVTHDGRPDWGAARVVDSWSSPSRLWAEQRQMPHHGWGSLFDPLVEDEIKWVNEGGLYDTINLNYRDADASSYFGFGSSQYTHGTGTLIAQSVPRSALNVIPQEEVYPFLPRPSIFNDSVSDLFNSTYSVSTGLSTGGASASLGFKNLSGDTGTLAPSLSLSPIMTQTHNPYDTETYAADPNESVGVAISGVLFPADRGVVALIRFPSNEFDISNGFNGQASNADEVLDRCVAAINLGQGVGPNDGLPGGLFTEGATNSFPSRATGQYDLYEVHTGSYAPHHSRSGGNPNITDPGFHNGQVRLLKDPLAFNVQNNTTTLGIPVLFSPFEFVRSVGVAVLKQNKNFLAYRMPVLRDYSPTGLFTPIPERDRFFAKYIPNKDQDQEAYDPLFDNAGGYVTFGSTDNTSLQVARYRHVFDLMDMASDTFENIVSSGVHKEYNFGSFALLHFKTEAAFEKLVRDGIAPSDGDLYSLNLIDYTDPANNVGASIGNVQETGAVSTTEVIVSSESLSLFRPNVNLEMKETLPYYGSSTISPQAETQFLHPDTDGTNRDKIQRYNTYFSFISGVIYVHPTTPFSYEGHPAERGGVAEATRIEEQRHSHLKVDVEFDARVTDSFSEWTSTTPSTDNPYASQRPLAQVLTSSLTAQDNLSITHTGSGLANHQSVWLEGEMGSVTIYPTGDSVKPITALSTWDVKDGMCTLSTSATRTSVMVNKPHRMRDNVGVEVVVDDVETSNTKVLYHSSRKVSLLEMYGNRFNPQGVLKDGSGSTAISSITDIYTASASNEGPYGDFNHNFVEFYLFAGWRNDSVLADPNHPTALTSPRRAGQSFSIYRYDEEGYKVYQPLSLLPRNNNEADGYVLELCSGWSRVDENDNDVVTPDEFKYPANRPVYRPTSSGPEELNTWAVAKFVGVEGVDYYVECYPSVPFGLTTADHEQPNTSIEDEGATGLPDLLLAVHTEPNPVNVWVVGVYLQLYKSIELIPSTQCEWLGTNLDPNVFPFNSDPVSKEGFTSHIRAFWYDVLADELAFRNLPTHPHPRPSLDHNGFINYGIVWVEVPPTGNRELPEYGNFTQDISGYITVSGLGNTPYYTEDQIHAVSPENNRRMPLQSLFTLRKDTQERFLDESYRLEHSLYHLFLDPNDPETAVRFSNSSDNASYEAASLGVTDFTLRENLAGQGIQNPGAGVNGGYIAFPVRDLSTVSYDLYTTHVDTAREFTFSITAGHGGAGYLRNSWHIRRATFSSDPNTPDWREAQVMGLPDMTRNLLTGGHYGTPPRGILVYPYWDFDGDTNTTLEGQDLTTNPLIASSKGFHLPNTGKATGDAREGDDWVDDDVTAVSPKVRHAQPDYSEGTLLADFAEPLDYPDVGYLRAFDVNFGGSVGQTPQLPYWNKTWFEEDGSYRSARDAQNYGLLEKKEWVRARQLEDGSVEFAPVKLRLVGVDWDMISYVDPSFPLQQRDGLVHTIDGKKYLMRKRVMRVFVKVPGLTTWLDVGVMDNQVGESYLHFIGDKTDVNVGRMDPNGPTASKTDSLSDGAGCCLSYQERYLPEEGVVCVDLDLNLGLVPAFNPLGTDSYYPASGDDNLVYDEYLDIRKPIRVDNCLVDKTYTREKLGVDTQLQGASRNFEAPILVKVVLSHPDHPKYEIHPTDFTKLVNAADVDDNTLLISDLANESPANETIIDIRPTPTKSYRGHSFPPDDRAPLWARRGLMGIEVLRPDGTNYDRDLAIDRPDFTDLDLYANPTLYYARSTNIGLYESYLKSTSDVTNQVTYTYGEHSARELGDEIKKPLKGDG